MYRLQHYLGEVFFFFHKKIDLSALVSACVILNNRLSVSVEKFCIGTSLKISQLINNGDFYFICIIQNNFKLNMKNVGVDFI